MGKKYLTQEQLNQLRKSREASMTGMTSEDLKNLRNLPNTSQEYSGFDEKVIDRLQSEGYVPRPDELNDEALQNAAASTYGNLESLGLNTVNALSTFGTALGSTAGMIGVGIPTGIIKGIEEGVESGSVIEGIKSGFDGLINNGVSEGFNKLNNAIHEEVRPIKSTAEESGSFGDRLTFKNLSELFLEGAAFVGSSMVGGSVASKGLKALSNSLQNTTKIAKAIKAGNAMKYGDMATDFNTSKTFSNLFGLNSKGIAGSIIGRTGEAGIEAYGTGEATRSELDQENQAAIAETGQPKYSEEEIEERVNLSKRITFGFNLALGVVDAAQNAKIFEKFANSKNLAKYTAKSGDDFIVDATKLGVERWSKPLNLAKTVAFQAGTEAGEELSQFTAGELATKLAVNNYDDDVLDVTTQFASNLLPNMLRDALTNPEAQMSMLAGGMLGGPMGIYGGKNQYDALKKNVDNLVKNLNVQNQTDKKKAGILKNIQVLEEKLKTAEPTEAEKLQGELANKKNEYRELVNSQFSEKVINSIQSGKYDEFIDEIKALDTTTKDEINQLGFELTDNETPKSIVEQSIKIAKKVKENYDAVEELYGGATEPVKRLLTTYTSLADFYDNKIELLNQKIGNKKLELANKTNPIIANEINVLEQELVGYESSRKAVLDLYQNLRFPKEQAKVDKEAKKNQAKQDDQVKKVLEETAKKVTEDPTQNPPVDTTGTVNPPVEGEVITSEVTPQPETKVTETKLPFNKGDKVTYDGKSATVLEVKTNALNDIEFVKLKLDNGKTVKIDKKNIPTFLENLETNTDSITLKATTNKPDAETENPKPKTGLSPRTVDNYISFDVTIKDEKGDPTFIVDIDKLNEKGLYANDVDKKRIDIEWLNNPDVEVVGVKGKITAEMQTYTTKKGEEITVPQYVISVNGKNIGISIVSNLREVEKKRLEVLKPGESLPITLRKKVSNKGLHYTTTARTINNLQDKNKIKLGDEFIHIVGTNHNGTLKYTSSHSSNLSTDDLQALEFEVKHSDGSTIKTTLDKVLAEYEKNAKPILSGQNFMVIKDSIGRLSVVLLDGVQLSQTKNGKEKVDEIYKELINEFSKLTGTDEEKVNSYNKFLSSFKPLENLRENRATGGVALRSNSKADGIIATLTDKTYKEWNKVMPKAYQVTEEDLAVSNNAVTFTAEGKRLGNNAEVIKLKNPIKEYISSKFTSIDVNSFGPASFLKERIENGELQSKLLYEAVSGEISVQYDLNESKQVVAPVAEPEVDSMDDIMSALGIVPIETAPESKPEKSNEFEGLDDFALRPSVTGYKVWDKAQEMSWLQNVLPQVSTEVHNSLLDIHKKFGVNAFGVFHNAVIHLANNTAVGTTYHEAFHAVFRMYLSDAEQVRLYNQLKSEGIAGTELEMEEILAERFREYVEGRKEKSAIKKFFDKLIYLIKNSLGLATYNDLFKHIDSEGFANANIVRDVSKFAPANKLVNDQVSSQKQKQYVDLITFLIQQELMKAVGSKSIVAINFNDLTIKDINEVTDSVKAILEKQYEKTNGENLKIILDNFDKEGNNYRKESLKQLSSMLGLNYSQETQELLDENKTIDNTKKERIYEQSFFEQNPRDVMDKEIKAFLSFIPKTKINNGVTSYVKNDIGFYDFVPFTDIYSYLLDNLSGLNNLDKMIERMEYLATANNPMTPTLKYILSRLIDNKNTLGEQLLNDDHFLQFRNAFFTTMGKAYLELYSFIEFNNGWTTININNNSLDKQLYNGWKEDYVPTTSNMNLKASDLESAYTELNKVITVHRETVEKYLAKNNGLSDINIVLASTNPFVSGEAQVASVLRKIANIEKEFYVDKYVGTLLNGENKAVYAYNKSTYAKDLFDAMLLDTTDNPLNDFKTNPYYKSNHILGSIQSELKQGKKDTRLGYFDTIKSKRDTEGTPFDELAEDQALATKFGMANKAGYRGIFFLPTPADRSNSGVIELQKLISSKEPSPFEFTNGKWSLDKNRKGLKFANWIKQSVENEFNRIKFVKSKIAANDISDINFKGYLEDGQYFNHYNYLNSIDLPANITFEEFWKSAESIVFDNMAKLFEAQLQEFVDFGLIELDKNTYSITDKGREFGISSEGYIGDSIGEYFANSYQVNKELSDILMGDPAFYKKGKGPKTDAITKFVEISKRASQPATPGDKVNTSLGGTKARAKVIVVPDTKINSDYINTLISSLYDIDIQRVNEITDNKTDKDLSTEDQFIFNLAKSYNDINSTDAQGLITLSRYKDLVNGLGQYKGTLKSIIDKAESGKPLTKEELYVAMQPLKGHSFGKVTNKVKNGEQEFNFSNPYLIKYAVIPLLPQFMEDAKGDIKKLYEKMNREKIDEAVFESGVKVGENDYYEIKEGKLEVKKKTIDNLVPFEFDNKYYRFPQVVPFKDKTSINFGSQTRKEMSVYMTPEEKLVYEQTLTDWLKLKNKNFKAKNITSRENLQSLVDKIKETLDASGNGMNEDLEYALQVIEGELAVPTDFPTIRSKVESIIFSILQKELIDLKTPGVSAVQVSTFVSSDSLSYITENADKKGEYLPAEIIVSPQYFINHILKKGLNPQDFMTNGTIDKTKIDPELLKGVLYRIPTQGAKSMLPFVIKDFLPHSFGGVAILPNEFLVSSGSDFDVDKVFIEMFNVDIVDNQLVRYSGKDEIQQLQDKIVQIHFDTLLKPNTIKEIILPNATPRTDATIEAVGVAKSNLVYDYNTPQQQEKIRKNNQAGKSGTGIWANMLQSHSVMQGKILTSFKVDVLVNGKMKSQPVKFLIESIEYTSVSEEFNSSGGTVINGIVEKLDYSVDNAKDNKADKVNDNKLTASINSLLTRLSRKTKAVESGLDLASLFLAQPVIRKITKNISNNMRGRKEQAILDQVNIALEKLGGKLLTAEEIVDGTKLHLTKQEILDNLENPSTEYMIKALNQFYWFNEFGSDVTNASIALGIDKGYEGTSIENNKKQSKLDDTTKGKSKYLVIDSGQFEATHIGQYAENFNTGLETANELFGFDRNPIIEAVYEKLKELNDGNDLSASDTKTLLYEAYNFVFADPNQSFYVSNERLESLLFGKESLAKKIKAYKASTTNPNSFIEYLNVDLGKDRVKTDTVLYDYVTFNNTAKLSPEQMRDIKTSYMSLLNGSDVEKQLAADILDYSIGTLGFSFGPLAILPSLPIEVFAKNGMLDYFKTLDYSGFDSKYFFYELLLNNLDNFKFVDRIYEFNPKYPSKHQAKLKDFIETQLETEQYKPIIVSQYLNVDGKDYFKGLYYYNEEIDGYDLIPFSSETTKIKRYKTDDYVPTLKKPIAKDVALDVVTQPVVSLDRFTELFMNQGIAAITKTDEVKTLVPMKVIVSNGEVLDKSEVAGKGSNIDESDLDISELLTNGLINTKGLKKINVKDAEVFTKQVFTEEESLKVFNFIEKLYSEKYNLEHSVNDKFGKVRRSMYFSDTPYTYSGVTRPANLGSPELQRLVAKITRELGFEDNYFDMVLINEYKDGSQKIGFHTDNEPILNNKGKLNPSVVTISFGDERTMILRGNGNEYKIPMKSGLGLIMGKDGQINYKHGIDSENSKDKRFSITLRHNAEKSKAVDKIKLAGKDNEKNVVSSQIKPEGLSQQEWDNLSQEEKNRIIECNKTK